LLTNTESTYGSVAKWLHWLIALWVLTAYVVIIYLDWRSDAFPLPGLDYHKAVGFTILIPVSLRIVWRFFSPPPKLPAGIPVWQRWASGLSHFVLYFLLLAMPLSGYFGNGGGVNYGLFRVPPFGRTAIAAWMNDTVGFTYAQQNDFFDAFHYGVVGPYVFWVLILFHASAAIYHHVAQKDDILIRMLPGERMRKHGIR
jgi:cytochrome b561